MTTPVEIEFKGAESANRLASAVEGLESKLNDLHRGFGEGAENLRAFMDLVEDVAERVSSLSQEQEALDRNSVRLGLDFNAAADAAGRFTDETDTMAAATRFAEAGFRLTQEELNSLTRVAAVFSQNTGRPMAEVMQQLADGTLNGTEALRRFGPELAAMQGPAHTVGERMRVLVEHARELPPATDDAASGLARLRDSAEDAARVVANAAATAFVDLITAQNNLSSSLDATNDAYDNQTTRLRALGSAAGEVALTVIRAGQAIAGGVAAAFLAPATLFRTVFQAMDLARRGQFGAAFDAMSNFGTQGALGAAVEFAGQGVDQFTDLVTGDAGARAAAATAARPGVAALGQRADGSAEAGAMLFGAGAATGRAGRSGGGAGGGEQHLTAAQEMARAEALAANERAFAAQDQATADATATEEKQRALRRLFEQENRDAATSEEDKQKRAREAAAREAEEARAAGDRAVAERARRTDIMVGLFEREHDAAISLRDALVGTYDAATEALGTYLGALLSGEEASARAVLTAIDRKAQQVAGESAIQALQATAEGIYYSITAPPIAATKFLAAAKFGALALGAGLTAAAIPNAPAAGGGGRGGGAAAAPARLDPGGGSGSGGPTIVNINVTSGVASTPRDTARAVRRVLGDGAALTGIGLPANVLGGM